jgi:hypothetical protein
MTKTTFDTTSAISKLTAKSCCAALERTLLLTKRNSSANGSRELSKLIGHAERAIHELAQAQSVRLHENANAAGHRYEKILRELDALGRAALQNAQMPTGTG